MLKNQRSTDSSIHVPDCLLLSAEKELSAFFRAIDLLFGSEQARLSASDWIEELERMEWPSVGSTPDWRQLTIDASSRLNILTNRRTLALLPDRVKELQGNVDGHKMRQP